MPNCLVCAQPTVEEVLVLGSTALANKFLTRDELNMDEPKFPLKLGFCHGCGHVQLTTIVPPGAMFEDYLYVSAASDTLKAHLYDLSEIIVQRQNLKHSDLVVDVGCNDGTLLTGFLRHNLRTLGVDPAENLASFTRASDIDRWVTFFDSSTAQRIATQRGKASVITLTNTFPHIQDLRDFVEAVQILLAPGGALIIETHYLLDLLKQDAFDTIYHEHVSYWSLGPLIGLFDAAGMEVVSAERLQIGRAHV